MLDEFVKKHGFIGWYETSAQDDVNIGTYFLIFTFFYAQNIKQKYKKIIDKAMMTLIKEVLRVSKENAPPKPSAGPPLQIETPSNQNAPPQSGGCC